MNALDDILTSYSRMAEDERIPAARAQLAALRATANNQARKLDIQATAIETARERIRALINYRDQKVLNFQLEKADDYINALRSWLAANPAPSRSPAKRGA